MEGVGVCGVWFSARRCGFGRCAGVGEGVFAPPVTLLGGGNGFVKGGDFGGGVSEEGDFLPFITAGFEESRKWCVREGRLLHPWFRAYHDLLVLWRDGECFADSGGEVLEGGLG